MSASDDKPSFPALDALGAQFQKAAEEDHGKPRPALRRAMGVVALGALGCFLAFTGPGQATAEGVANFIGIDNPDNRSDIREVNEVLSTPGEPGAKPTESTPALLDGCEKLLKSGGYNLPCIQILGRDAPERLPADLPTDPDAK